ncbi:MAG: cyclic nucleotide-binding domain-containing protein, partial [Thermoanaerobaculia bacterium]
MSKLPRIETVLFLQGVDFFSACTAEQILRISAIVHQRRLAAGEKVYGPGEQASELYCVVEGAVGAGNGANAYQAGPGETFGVLEILSGRLRSQAAVAEEDSLVLEITADDLFDLLSHN